MAGQSVGSRPVDFWKGLGVTLVGAYACFKLSMRLRGDWQLFFGLVPLLLTVIVIFALLMSDTRKALGLGMAVGLAAWLGIALLYASAMSGLRM